MRGPEATNTYDTLSAVLASEHQQVNWGLEQFGQRLATGQVEIDLFREAAACLRRHIYLEEEVLFPEMAKEGLVDPIAVLMREHGEIWRFMDGIPELISGNASVKRVQNALDALCSLLDEHNFREERTLYPLVDHLLSSHEQEEAMRQLKMAALPSEWVCRVLRDKGDPGSRQV